MATRFRLVAEVPQAPFGLPLWQPEEVRSIDDLTIEQNLRGNANYEVVPDDAPAQVTTEG